MDRQNPQTNGKRKATQVTSHKEAYTYTLRKREKGRKNIYLLGSLRSSASIQQMFCRSCSTCTCSFDTFVGRKVISTSYSSAILKVSPPPRGGWQQPTISRRRWSWAAGLTGSGRPWRTRSPARRRPQLSPGTG